MAAIFSSLLSLKETMVPSGNGRAFSFFPFIGCPWRVVRLCLLTM